MDNAGRLCELSSTGLMKRALGSLLCIVAIAQIVNLMIGPKVDTTAHRVQSWALVGVLLAIGIPLSAAKKPQDSNKK